ncbi:efflux RND transporter periplasmic adaptor subunit [Desulfobulbus elongatus]|uniref:efflux RND transporter periplasmic adaptor subunit n=1 Tax=Desulfobulbus elongatus TaxID=53332 RepID=UPI000487A590|nr:efflux RND transporter periplasmic adaptor subunit [Desulfobulbus elongatus]
MNVELKQIRWRIFLPLVLLMAAMAAAAIFFFSRDRHPEHMTAAVGRGSVEVTVLANGTVESDNLVSVGAQVSGQLKSLKVELGDTVKAGQLVAEIDSLPQQNTLRTQTAALNAVLAQRQAKEASLTLAELTYKRQTQMLKGDAASREDADTAEANLKVLRAEITALDAQIEQARIAVDTAQVDLGYTKISSPIDGVVVAIVTKEGQTVNANQTAPTIIKVARLDQMTIRVEISEADVIRVKPGLKATFTILGEPDNRYPAAVKSIEPAPESIATETTTTSSTSTSTSTAIYYIGILDVPNPDGKLRISMTTQVNIVLAEATDVLVIPAAALGDKGKDGLYTVRVETASGTIEQRRVKIGLNTNVQAEVVEGLREGERVIIGDQIVAAASTTSTQRRPPMPRML